MPFIAPPPVPSGVSSAAVDAAVATALAALVGAAPSNLDTLPEIDAQLLADEGAATALAALVGTKQTAAQVATAVAAGVAGKEPAGLSGSTLTALSTAYAPKILPRRRDLPGFKNLPTLNTAAATATNGVAGAATAITGSVLVPNYMTTAFTYSGTSPVYLGTGFPDYANFTSNWTAATGTAYPSGYTSTSPWAVEFDFDTTDGLFEISNKGSGGKIRLLINGLYVTALPTFTTPSDGNGYLHLVSLPTAGTYRIRLEFDGSVAFSGIRTIATNSVRAAPPRTLRCLVVGDSFSEPTIVDSGGAHLHDGWPQKFGYLTGWDVWSAGKGGTGFLNAGTGVTFFRRVSDITRNNPDVVVWAGGINDTASGTAAQFGAQVTACLQAVKTALPNVIQIVLSPFWRGGINTFPLNLLAMADAAKVAAAANGALFVDILRFPASTVGVRGDQAAPAPGTLSNSPAQFATTFQSSTLYPTGTIVQIGTGSNAEAKQVTGTSGTGPYTHTVAILQLAHTSGEAITPFGGSFITGSGKQGSTVGDGTADRYTGSDGTHPTVAGHENIAATVFNLLMQQLPA